MINGVINVYKEKGYTSFDVVAKLRGILHQKKIGHTGTLDPDAEGVLPVCLGKATKLVDMLTGETKTYEAGLLLGKETDTQDISGTVLASHEVSCTEEELIGCLHSFEGEQLQIPPMYSALKVHGRRLYELAREGKTVEREARPVHFYEIKMLSCQLPRAVIQVTCSRGTYIRTLCHDVGEKLGCGGCMESLKRVRVGAFRIEDALRLDEISRKVDEGVLSEILIPVDRLFALPALQTLPQADALAHNGNRIPASLCRRAEDQGTGGSILTGPRVEPVYVTDPVVSTGYSKDDSIAGQVGSGDKEADRHGKIYDSEGNFIGIFAWKSDENVWKPVRMFYDPA